MIVFAIIAMITGVLFLLSEKFREIISPIIAFVIILLILSRTDGSNILFIIIIALISHGIGKGFESLYLIGFFISFLLLGFSFMILTGIRL